MCVRECVCVCVCLRMCFYYAIVCLPPHNIPYYRYICAHTQRAHIHINVRALACVFMKYTMPPPRFSYNRFTHKYIYIYIHAPHIFRMFCVNPRSYSCPLRLFLEIPLNFPLLHCCQSTERRRLAAGLKAETQHNNHAHN